MSDRNRIVEFEGKTNKVVSNSGKMTTQQIMSAAGIDLNQIIAGIVKIDGKVVINFPAVV